MVNPVNVDQKKSKNVAKGNPHKGSKGYQYGAKGASGVNDHSGQNLPTSKIKA